jgi:hypothetical protein
MAMDLSFSGLFNLNAANAFRSMAIMQQSREKITMKTRVLDEKHQNQ